MIGTACQKPKILAAHRYIFSVNVPGMIAGLRWVLTAGFYLNVNVPKPVSPDKKLPPLSKVFTS
jgi:hypothetical protein